MYWLHEERVSHSCGSGETSTEGANSTGVIVGGSTLETK